MEEVAAAFKRAVRGADTVVHFGAGKCSELPEYLAQTGRRIVLIEPNPRAARALRERLAPLANIHVVQCAVSTLPGEAVLHIYNLEGRSSLRRATGLRDLYPGLRLVRSVTIPVVSGADLLNEFDVSNTRSVCLIIDTPGEERSVIEGMARDDVLSRVGSLVLRCPRTPMYEGAASQAEIVDLLDTYGFAVADEVGGGHVDSVVTLRPSHWKLENSRLKQRLKALGGELGGLREERQRLQATLDVLAAKQALSAKKVDDAERTIQTLEKERATLEAELAQARLEINNLRKASADFEQVLKHQARELANSKERAHRLDTERQELIQRGNALELSVARAEAQAILLRDVLLESIAASSVAARRGGSSGVSAFKRKAASLRSTHQDSSGDVARLFVSEPPAPRLADERMLLALRRAQDQVEMGRFDANGLEALRAELRELAPRGIEWAELSSEVMRAPLLRLKDDRESRPTQKEMLYGAALSAAALIYLRAEDLVDVLGVIAGRYCLSEAFCRALIAARAAEASSSSSDKPKGRSRQQVGGIRSSRCRLLKCNGPGEVAARALYFLYQESRDELLREISENDKRLNLLVDRVTAASARARMYLPPLIRNDPASWLWRFEYLSSIYEFPTAKVLAEVAKDVEWAIDGGAHIGYLSKVIKESNPHCDLIAVEANPALVDIAKHNLPHKRVEVVHGAITNASGSCLFYPGSGHSNSSLLKGATSASNDSITVPALSLDELLPVSYISRPGLIKLDIEAFELEALQGASKLLTRSNRCILVLENNPRLLKLKSQESGAVHEYLRHLGFHGRQILDSFGLSRPGFVDEVSTRNYVFAKEECWEWLQDRLCI